LVKGKPHWDNIRKNTHRISIELISDKHGGVVSLRYPYPEELTDKELERFMRYVDKTFIRKWNPTRRYKK